MELRSTACLAAFLLAGCAAAPRPELTRGEEAAITSAIEARIQGYGDAAGRRDAEWFAAFWADDPDFLIAGDGDLLAGYDTYIPQMREELAGIGPMLEFEVSDQHTHVIARDAASHALRFRWGFITATGDTVRAHGSWLYVFRHIDGEWRVVQSGGTHIME